MDPGYRAQAEACEVIAEGEARLQRELDDIERRLNPVERSLRIAFGGTLPAPAAGTTDGRASR